jgi:hypothetical protein
LGGCGLRRGQALLGRLLSGDGSCGFLLGYQGGDLTGDLALLGRQL